MSHFVGKDMLLLDDGSTYHVGIKAGDVFPRIITVGPRARAQIISTHFDEPPKIIASSRDFTTYSGRYKGVGVSVISIGMGAQMMDFMIREVSFVHPGPLAVIRVGTCGLFNPNLSPGTVCCAGKGSAYIYTNYAYNAGYSKTTTAALRTPMSCKELPPFVITAPIQGCDILNQKLVEACKTHVSSTVVNGSNVCGETFYSCQGRAGFGFNDGCTTLQQDIINEGFDFCEMETHQLFHLASIRQEKTFVASCGIGILNRANPEMVANITQEMLKKFENETGLAALEALIKFEF